ncbi:MAG TPA: hypothetical protein VFG23_21015 [Polyangia bacterium]|nr:hypothetical protein [Polyangia bacterium]
MKDNEISVRRRRRELRVAAVEKSLADSLEQANRAIERATADLRALAALARSAALPPAKRVDELERTALGHFNKLRESLGARLPESPSELAVVEASAS